MDEQEDDRGGTSNAAREEALASIWSSTAKALAKALADKPTAAHLNVARQFLSDNGTNSDALSRMGFSDAIRAVVADVPFKETSSGVGVGVNDDDLDSA